MAAPPTLDQRAPLTTAGRSRLEAAEQGASRAVWTRRERRSPLQAESYRGEARARARVHVRQDRERKDNRHERDAARTARTLAAPAHCPHVRARGIRRGRAPETGRARLLSTCSPTDCQAIPSGSNSGRLRRTERVRQPTQPA